MISKSQADIAIETAKKYGYSCKLEIRMPYKSYPKNIPRHIVIAEKSNEKYFLRLDNRDVMSKIMKIQKDIPFIAPIANILPTKGNDKVVFVKKIEGDILWDIDVSKRPTIEQVESSLEKFIQSIHSFNLVHKDIRPWNILFDTENSEIKVIDWEYSEFVDPAEKTKKENDRTDGKRTIEVLREPEKVNIYFTGNGPKQENSKLPKPW